MRGEKGTLIRASVNLLREFPMQREFIIFFIASYVEFLLTLAELLIHHIYSGIMRTLDFRSKTGIKTCFTFSRSEQGLQVTNVVQHARP